MGCMWSTTASCSGSGHIRQRDLASELLAIPAGLLLLALGVVTLWRTASPRRGLACALPRTKTSNFCSVVGVKPRCRAAVRRRTPYSPASSDGRQLARVYGFTDLDGSQPEAFTVRA